MAQEERLHKTIATRRIFEKYQEGGSRVVLTKRTASADMKQRSPLAGGGIRTMTNISQTRQRLTLLTAEIGWRAYDAKDYSAALAFFEPYKDDPIAQNFIGLIYLNDESLSDLKAEGIEWLRRSAEADFEFAWLNLGNCYSRGIGTEVDLRVAIGWYAKGADFGSSSCQFNLGLAHCELEEFAEATKWLHISAMLGSEEGRRFFDFMSVKATKEQYEEGFQNATQWLESKLDADDSQIHQDLRNWLSQHKETSETVWKDIVRISAV